MHPISVQIITRGTASQREIRHEYMAQSRFPRWEMLKIFVHALFHVRFR
ncbi:MAG TPA: hypothetical protein VMG09_03890 [Bacteroidota bacterium]|nr:hypothetical protein [Bacteroidota bacterium]